MRSRSKAAMAAFLAPSCVDPGLASMAVQERHQPRSIWADPARYRGQPKVATSESAPVGVPESTTTDPQALLLKAPEVCRLLGGVSLRTLRRMENQGLLRSVHLLRHKLYARQDVEALVENLRKWKP